MKIKLFTIPNILTLANLFCGSLAVITAVSLIWMDNEMGLVVPFLFIIASAIFDFFDGFAARLLKQYSPLGVQLDSLADMVSFGLAPSVIMMVLFIKSGGVGYWSLVPLIIALFSALRLAKFNVDDEQKDSFIGLPTPACALFVGSLGYWLSEPLGYWITDGWLNSSMPEWVEAITLSPSWILAISVILAWLLISPIRMFSFKFDKKIKNKKSNIFLDSRYPFVVASIVIFFLFGLKSICLIIIAYIITSIVNNIVPLCRKKKA